MMNRANAPGKSHRKGVSLKAIMRRFPSNEKAAEWFIKQRWPSGVCCPYCGSLNVQVGCQHKTMPFRCREKTCGRKRFSVRTGTVMECSKIGYQDWMLVMFLVMTNLKGVSSMKLHRDLEINQRPSLTFLDLSAGRPIPQWPVNCRISCVKLTNLRVLFLFYYLYSSCLFMMRPTSVFVVVEL